MSIVEDGIMVPDGYVLLDYDYISNKTEMAHLVDFGDEKKWIPNSVIRVIGDNKVVIKEWFANKEKLI